VRVAWDSHSGRRPRRLGLSRQHNSTHAVDLSPGCISGPRSGQEAREKSCRRVLAAVEDQNSDFCDLDPARLEAKGKMIGVDTGGCLWPGIYWQLARLAALARVSTPPLMRAPWRQASASCLFLLLSSAWLQRSSIAITRAIEERLGRRHRAAVAPQDRAQRRHLQSARSYMYDVCI